MQHDSWHWIVLKVKVGSVIDEFMDRYDNFKIKRNRYRKLMKYVALLLWCLSRGQWNLEEGRQF